MSKIWRRIYFLLHRRRLERELADEMEAHRAMMPEYARAGFGNPILLREQSREIWIWIWLEQFWQDLCYGVRVLRRAPGFTVGAITVLALGVGVNLAEFQIFDAVLFHRLQVRDANAVIRFARMSREGRYMGFSPATVQFYRANSKSLDWLVSEDNTFKVNVESETGLRAAFVSPDYFTSLAVTAAWGRTLDFTDSQPGAAAVAVLGAGYWQTQWGADPHVVGRVVRINNQPTRIVGVLPYNFDGLSMWRTAIWLPGASRPQIVAGSIPLETDYQHASQALYGKLKPGVPKAAAEGELSALTRELIRLYPHSFRPDEHIQGELMEESLVNAFKRSPAIAIFIVMVLLVLLSACANLGNMLLARGLARQREIDIRLAVGAGRPRIVRQLMTESLILALLGAAAGLAVGELAARLLMDAVGTRPDIHAVMRWPIFAAAFALALVSAVAFGLPAALQSGSRKRTRSAPLRQTLVAVQVAVSCLLLITSAVLAHNGIRSASIDLAFDYKNMILVDPQLYLRNLPPSASRHRLDALLTRVSALPGVDSATLADAPPLSGRRIMESLPGKPRIDLTTVAPPFFHVMNLPVLRGRAFSGGDQNTAIVSESAARAIWPNEEPLGKTLRLAKADRTIVGIVKDSGANLLTPHDNDSIEAYLPLQPADLDRSELVVHSRGDPAQVARMIVPTATDLGEIVSVVLMRTSRDNFLDGQRRLVTLIGAVGAVATALAAAGMFALVAFAVAQRKRELGIRIAIGARPKHILGVLLVQNGKPTAGGMVIGTILALALSRLVSSLVELHEGDVLDPTGYAAGLAGFLLIAALASLSPAMRALRIDPAETLREE